MPCFNTHWLVAMKCIKDAELPNSIVKGFEKYIGETQLFKKNLGAIYAINDVKTGDAFFKEGGGLDAALKDYNKKLKNAENHDDITCFSAYMLGACGPDFWTVPSGLKDMASQHFNLGHYNRTHRQFQMAIKRWKELKKKPGNEFQIQVEQAYFYGMASHIATDCVIHQLVNVSAGAYDLLEGKWSNEQSSNVGKVQYMFHGWNTHNKVENYWDSYIRYRYLGDTGHLFDSEDRKRALDDGNWMTVLNFPITEVFIFRLERDLLSAKKNKNAKKIEALKRLIKGLKKDENKFKIEQPFILPRIFCDRVRARAKNGIKPFIYDIVVHKKTGAYPGEIDPKNKTLKGVVFEAAVIEKESAQMKAGTDKKGNQAYSEENKLNFFSSGENTEAGATSFNYLNYVVCPNLDRVRLYGWDHHYHLNALAPFTESAMRASTKFIGCLSDGIKTGNIGLLGKFWNLDTGLGLEVKQLPSDTPHEVITELNFIHINNRDVTGPVDYTKNKNYLNAIKKTAKPYPDTAEIVAFNTVSEQELAVFKNMKSIEETDENKYLNTLLLSPKVPTPDPASKINGFFTPRREIKTKPLVAKTANQTTLNLNTALNIKHRLNLLMTVPIADLNPLDANDGLGFEIMCDGDKTIREMKPATDTETKKWLKTSKAIVRSKAERNEKLKSGVFVRTDTGIYSFNARLFLNLEKSKELKRVSKKGIFNNVIERDKNEQYYSRNYSVGTSRKNVLYPVAGGDFAGRDDFAKIDVLSPTEKVFFSIYLLTRTTDEWYDMLSKEPVSKNQLEKLIKIESLGFVKIVIFYELTTNGGAKLAECYIDGLPVRVVQGRPSR